MNWGLSLKDHARLIVVLIYSCLTLPLFAGDIHIPSELKDSGFTKYILVRYSNDTAYEYYTFYDFTTQDSGETITFVVAEGVVIDYYKEKSK